MVDNAVSRLVVAVFGKIDVVLHLDFAIYGHFAFFLFEGRLNSAFLLLGEVIMIMTFVIHIIYHIISFAQKLYILRNNVLESNFCSPGILLGSCHPNIDWGHCPAKLKAQRQKLD